MNNIQLFILVIVLGWLGSYLFDWWVLNPVAFILGFWVIKDKIHVFVPSLLAGFSLWLFMAAYQIGFDFSNIVLLKSSGLFGLNKFLLLLMIGLIGGLLAGCGASAGYYFRKIISKQEEV